MSKVYKEQLRTEMNADRKKLGKPSIEDDDAVPTQKDRKCFLAILAKVSDLADQLRKTDWARKI